LTHDIEDHISPQPTSEIFVPEAERLANPEEFQPSFEPSTLETIPQAQPSIPFPPAPSFCIINLREGCYRISYRPNSELHIYNGTFRVDRSEGNTTTISGDFYQFLNPIIGPPSTLSDLLEDVTAPLITRPIPIPPIPIPHIPFGIPVYPRNRYYSYLKVVGIQLNTKLGKCNLTLTVEEYLYTQPPVGSFDGSFATTANRTFTVVLSPKAPPVGFTSSHFEGKLYEGGMEKGSFSMGWVSPFFRKATLEVAVLQGATAPQPVPAATGSGTEDFRTVFATCGWDVNAVINQTPLAVPPGINPNACWTAAALHDLMTTTVHSTDTHLDKVWHLHVLVVLGTLGCGRGIMFDSIGVPREGVASFCNDGYPSSESSNFGTAANQRQQDVPRAFMRSACHESGHGFNQIHQNATEEGEPGSDNSIMTTTPEVADVLGGLTTGDPGVFPTNIVLRFNRHVRHHMIHFPDMVVRPGGMSFGTGHNTTVPQSDMNRHYFSAEQLELKVSPKAKRVKLGEPLPVDWQIVNSSKVNIPVPNNISIEAQHSYISIYDPNGHSKLMKSFMIQTDTVRMQELKPGDKVESKALLFWSPNGFAFETPGRHIIELKTIWNYAGVQYGVRATTQVWCDYPISERDNEVASILLNEDVGKFIALGGGASHLEEAVSRIEKVKSAHSDHPAYRSIMSLEHEARNRGTGKGETKKKGE